GGGAVNFYAEPGVDHLALWQTPEQALGWSVDGQRRDLMSAADFVSQALAEAHRGPDGPKYIGPEHIGHKHQEHLTYPAD
ncbi:MAG: hypothetical protein AAGF01_10980, partial [Cyanobacteria bacterium P01_G01_bin.38]